MTENIKPLFISPTKDAHVIVVMSGKGGVGKSTVSSMLALSLASKGKRVGVLDADFHGPNIPRMLGVEGKRVLADKTGRLLPVEAGDIKVISLALMTDDPDAPVIWRGPLKVQVIKQLLNDVEWGEMDYLVIDLPPGTGDEPLSIAQQIPSADGVVMVTTPQEVALLDVRRALKFTKTLGLNVLGVVENMSGLICPHCGGEIEVFKKGGGERMAGELGVPFLGSVPLDVEVMRAGDEGRLTEAMKKETPGTVAFARVADVIIQMVEGEGGKR
ncbi:MAG: Mrp/NBP35 family ATP-binding protein [Thermoplasmata archaeon]|nr:Mrp/NBP35 family ATP-binding protein [Thermoplasmata archaeon]